MESIEKIKLESAEKFIFKEKFSAKEKLDRLAASLGACIHRNRINSKLDEDFPLGEFYQAYLDGDELLWMSMCRELLTGHSYESTIASHVQKADLDSPNEIEEEDDDDYEDEDEELEINSSRRVSSKRKSL